jgi:hypothetical protein
LSSVTEIVPVAEVPADTVDGAMTPVTVIVNAGTTDSTDKFCCALTVGAEGAVAVIVTV